MRHVAMHRPVAGIVGNEFNGARAADLNEHGRFDLLRRLGNLPAVGFYNAKTVAVQMHRMMIHRAQIHETETDAIAQLRDHRLGSGKNARVQGKDIEGRHFTWIRTHRSSIDAPFAQHESEIAIYSILRIARMNDE